MPRPTGLQPKGTVSKKYPGGSVEKHEKFKAYRKTLKKVIKRAKAQFYSNKFEECKGDRKKTWKIINQVRGKTKKPMKPLFKIDNKKITDRRIIANAFNKYFTSIADGILKKRKYEGHKSFHEYLLNSTNQSFLIYDCDNDEIKKRHFFLPSQKRLRS